MNNLDELLFEFHNLIGRHEGYLDIRLRRGESIAMDQVMIDRYKKLAAQMRRELDMMEEDKYEQLRSA